ncbi:zinc protease [Litorimonas taeanensis]|uniref:Zinc protease n=1 Tax=Litorimonas taeanensis TaxID=568099 RepID=A0A420WJ32_9PROT|nr:insulinase family protein [Litorimonas taeanensis]RKQ71034.1 zinc protease [Litorimonas taeanensis]
MRKIFIYPIVIYALFSSSCGRVEESAAIKAEASFVHEVSDLAVDPNIEYGKLENGLRYAVRSNSTPTKTATLLMRVDTGSLNESDETRGLAHFLEHMAFNGSKNIPEGEMIKRLEKFGLSFGADTNASTSFFETTYQLELPEVDEAILNETLMIMRETASHLTLDAEAIDRERGVILAEKRARSSPGFDAFIDYLEFFLGDTLIPDRLPIGTEDTIKSVTAEQFKAFYEGYYRPENTFVVFVGDVETDYAAKKIEEYFSDWQAVGEGAAKYEAEALSLETARTHYYVNPEIQTSLSLSVAQPLEKKDDTIQSRKDAFVESLGNRILSQRLGELSRTTDAPFISASAGTNSLFDGVRLSALSIQPEKGKWDMALKGAEPVLRQALEFGFSQSELDEQIANSRKSYEVSVQTASTRRTPNLARRILSAFGDDIVVTTPESALERFNDYADDITLNDVNQAFRKQWKGVDQAPQLYLATSEMIEDAESKLETALMEARQISVSPREEIARQEFAYSEWGTPGLIKSRETVQDIDFERVVFENGVKLNIKQTPYQKDIISINVALSGGELFLPREEPGLRIFAPNALGLGGLEAHSVDEIRKITAGRSVGVLQSMGTDRRVLSGATVPSDLDLQLNLMAAYVTAQGYRPEAKAQYDKYIKSFYPTLDSTPNGVASRDIPRLLRSGDTRFGYPSEDEMLRVTTDMVKAYLSPFQSNTAIEIAIVGDITPDEAIKSVARTFGAFPKQQEQFAEPSDEDIRLNFPKGSNRPVKLSHAGDTTTALYSVYWPTPDGRDAQTSREVSMLATLFRLRLTEVLREEEGASYSPSAFSFTPRTYPDYGYFGVSLEVSPDDIDRMSLKVDEIAAEFREGKLDTDMFERGMKPVLENIETSLESNSYWMDVIANGQTDEERLNRHRSRSEAYKNMTVEDLQSRAKTMFDPKTAYRIQILPEK